MHKIGVLNVFWFGLTEEHNTLGIGFLHRPEEDDARVGALIAKLGVDVLALVEIVDIDRLEKQVRALPGHWRVRDGDGKAVASSGPVAGGDSRQRVLFAWNDDAVELLRWARPIDVEPKRPPVVARFRSRTAPMEWTAVAVHPKSGALGDWRGLEPTDDDRKAGERRLALFEKVAAWLKNPPADFAGPAMLLGDFNSIKESPEAEPVRQLGWHWPEPSFLPATAEHRTTKTDNAIIDHMVLSPHWTFGDHEALAFDVDPAFLDPAHPAALVWKRTTDHRPVRMRVSL